ncbi:hypothetical protein [Chryseobacterium populi]|uniref:Uncharacterized protein n=1 Tax=Chryseobacterium populi TaxID=1144316 RepID=J2TB36_9FLAO|nr:hypothetical protein [Chryseobacterium populi]EJL75367.1 hypothetical protein PMI13_00514 [Chryseobacterium populi]
MEQAAILFGDFDGKGNALIIRMNNLSNPVYTVDGYLIGFTANNIDYFQFDKTDFKENEEKINAGYYSLQDWLEYWADKKKSNEIRKFDNSNFMKVQVGDQVSVVKQKITYDAQSYNLNEEYKYTWNLANVYSVPFKRNKIYIPDNITPQLKVYNPEGNATEFFNNNMYLINNMSSIEKKNEVASYLIYSAYCIHHINNSILTLFTEASYQSYIIEQKAYWSNPFSGASNLQESDVIKLLRDFYQEVLNFYVTGFRCKEKIKNAVGNKKLFYLTLFMSVKALTTLTAKLKIEVLKESVDEMSRIFEREAVENLAVRIANSFNANSLDRIDEFLEGLVKYENCIEKEDIKYTLYQYIYDRLSTSLNITKGLIQLSNWIVNTKFKATDTKGAFAQAIYILWQYSKYNPFTEAGELKPNVIGFKKLDNSTTPKISYDTVGDNNITKTFYYSHEAASEPFSSTVGNSYNFYFNVVYENAAPLIIPYNSNKSVGLYLNSFNFEFSGFKIKASEKYVAHYSTRGGMTQPKEALYGTYDIFQPVSLINTDIDSPVPIVTTTGNPTQISGLTINSFIPIFLLKYYDDAIDKSNAETLIGYTVDGVLTFSGIGNLTKLRHLRWAALGTSEAGIFIKENLRVLLGGLEFSSGVVSYLANFIDCNDNDEFCHNFKNFAMAFQLATLSLTAADGLASIAMRKSAKGMVQATGKTSQAEIIAELKNKLAGIDGNNSGQDIIDELAANIYYMDDAGSILDRLLKYSKDIRKRVNDKVDFANKVRGNAFDMFFYSADDIKEIAEHVLLKSNLAGDFLERFCADLVYIASKEGKKISKAELKKQISFWFDEIKKRGYASGFASLQKFKSFGQKANNYFKNEFQFWDEEILANIDFEHYDDYDDWLDFNFEDKVKLKVQGSANRKYLQGDPLEHVSGNDLPTGNPGDFEFALEMNPDDFNIFIQICKEYGKHNGKARLDNIGNISSKGFFHKDDILALFGSKFVDGLKNSTKMDLQPLLREKINFAIVKKGGPYDLEPYLDF